MIPHCSSLAPKIVKDLMCIHAWSHANMLGDQSCFINTLLICLDDEEEEMVTRTHSLSVSVNTSLSSLLNVGIALSNFFSLFIPRMISIHPLLTEIEKNSYWLHLHSCICELLAAGCICNSAFLNSCICQAHNSSFMQE
jgi:hypothetical protein